MIGNIDTGAANTNPDRGLVIVRRSVRIHHDLRKSSIRF
jgi:hypothetical protein